MPYGFINDRAAKLLLTDINLRDYVCLIISKLLKLNYNYVKDNLELVHNGVNKNQNIKGKDTDALFENDYSVINFEFNNEYQSEYIAKNNMYVFHLYLRQLKPGEKENKIKPIYQINVNNFDIYQNAEKPFFKKFRNINVIGLYNPTTPLNYSEKYLNEQVDLYKAATAGKSQLHILSAFYECFPQKITPSIGISHGIAWDNPSNKNHDAISFWNSKRMFIESAMNCDKMISVDTNTANWFQTIDYELGNQKIKVIPNYVNTNEFKEDNSFKKEGKIIITYPRRLYEPRGMYLLLDIVDDLFKKYDNIEIHFVGKGFDEDVNKIKEKMIKYPDKLFCYSKEPEKMNEVYKMSDISLVPTLYSEGTSLSCLEA